MKFREGRNIKAMEWRDVDEMVSKHETDDAETCATWPRFSGPVATYELLAW
jgi:hypothetical protein